MLVSPSVVSPYTSKKPRKISTENAFPAGRIAAFHQKSSNLSRSFTTGSDFIPARSFQILDKYGNVVRYTIKRAPRENYPMTILTLQPDAAEVLNNYGNALILRAQDVELAQFRSYYSRLRDKTLRIATLFAAQQNCSAIELRHIARAQQIAEQLRLSIHQLAAHPGQCSQPDTNIDEKILRVMLRKDIPLTAREVSIFIWNVTPDEAKERLELLTQKGIVKKREGGHTVRYIIA